MGEFGWRRTMSSYKLTVYKASGGQKTGVGIFYSEAIEEIGQIMGLLEHTEVLFVILLHSSEEGVPSTEQL